MSAGKIDETQKNSIKKESGKLNKVNVKNSVEEPFAQWKKEYEIGLLEVDQQHQNLLKIMNELYSGLYKDGWLRSSVERKSAFRRTAKQAVEYVKIHFSTEENYMIKFGYPDFKNHRKQHIQFVRELLNDVDKFEKGDSEAPEKFLHYLKDWLLNHIAEEDSKIGLFLKERNEQIRKRKQMN